MPRMPVLRVIVRELREMLPPTIFFAVGFNLIVLTGHLMVHDYAHQLFNFTIATTTALVVGKSVLLANLLPLIRRFDGAPLIVPILFKTLIYTGVVLVMRLLEALIEFWIADGTALAAFDVVQARFSWHRFAAVQIWISVLFLIYVTAEELATLFGAGQLRRLFFSWSSPERRLTWQARMRVLAAINRIAREHRVEELRRDASPAGDELFRLIGELGRPPRPGEQARP